MGFVGFVGLGKVEVEVYGRINSKFQTPNSKPKTSVK
jgi:hypothetical protein